MSIMPPLRSRSCSKNDEPMSVGYAAFARSGCAVASALPGATVP